MPETSTSSSERLSFPSTVCPLLLVAFSISSHLSDSCCVKVTVYLVAGPSLSSLPAVLWHCVNVQGFLIRLCTQTGPKAEAAPLCLKLTHSLSPFLFTRCLSLYFFAVHLQCVISCNLSIFSSIFFCTVLFRTVPLKHSSTVIFLFSLAPSLPAQQTAVLFWGQCRLCVWCHVVARASCHVRRRGRHGPPGPVEPQQRHGGVWI